MQLGLRLHDTEAVSLEERIKIIKQQGFTCAHMALTKVINEFPVDNTALTPGLAMYIKRMFQKQDIDIAVLGCYLNIANPDPEQFDQIRKTYLAHIRFASLLGCGVVGTETGTPNVNYQVDPSSRSEEAFQLFLDHLRTIVQYAQSMGVIIAIEPVRSHIVYDARRAKQVLEAINSPNLQIIFDPVNLLGVDNYENQVEVINEAITLLGEDIAVIHMKDFILRDGKLLSVAAGTGELNYQPIIEFIKRRKPFIHCTLEDTKPETVIAAREYIQRMWDSIN